jgi:hypothetical protein
MDLNQAQKARFRAILFQAQLDADAQTAADYGRQPRPLTDEENEQYQQFRAELLDHFENFLSLEQAAHVLTDLFTEFRAWVERYGPIAGPLAFVGFLADTAALANERLLAQPETEENALPAMEPGEDIRAWRDRIHPPPPDPIEELFKALSAAKAGEPIDIGVDGWEAVVNE